MTFISSFHRAGMWAGRLRAPAGLQSGKFQTQAEHDAGDDTGDDETTQSKPLPKPLRDTETNAVNGLWLALGVVIPALLAASAHAVPQNPQRPFTAATCAKALERYREALIGSPLISAVEGCQVLRQARSQAARLCGPTVDLDQITARSNDPSAPQIPTTRDARGN